MVKLLGLMALIALLTLVPLLVPVIGAYQGKRRIIGSISLSILLLGCAFGLYWLAGAPHVALILDLVASGT